MRFYSRNPSLPQHASPSSPSDSDPEKPYPAAYDGHHQPAYYDDDDEDVGAPALAPSAEKKLTAKIDLRVVPVLTVLYLLAFIDRVNISNAAIFGLTSDLHMGGTQLNTALTIFFVPYVLFEIPANLLLKRLKPHVWLSGCMFLFGLVSICQGLVRSYGGLLAARFFLGLAETGMFPGCFYLIGMWYRRDQAQRRFTFFFSSATLAGAFGGLLASAIGKMDHMRGYRGWRWIFILEGTLTCVLALIWYFVISDFPEDAKWLSSSERGYIRARLQADSGRAALERRTNLHDVGRFFKDYKVFLGGLMYFGLIVPAYGYAYFSPTIIQTYGYSPIQTQLHSVPPWAAAWAFSLLIAYLSDKSKHRLSYALFCIAIAIAGFAILISVHHSRHTEYAALFLCTIGAYSAMPIIICWFQQNLGGHHRRAIGSAWQIGFGNIGGIIATYVFLKQDAPRYTRGYSVCLAFSCLSAVACVGYAGACWRQNRLRDRTPATVGGAGGEREEVEAGDLAGSYRYLL